MIIIIIIILGWLQLIRWSVLNMLSIPDVITGWFAFEDLRVFFSLFHSRVRAMSVYLCLSVSVSRSSKLWSVCAIVFIIPSFSLACQCDCAHQDTPFHFIDVWKKSILVSINFYIVVKSIYLSANEHFTFYSIYLVNFGACYLIIHESIQTMTCTCL